MVSKTKRNRTTIWAALPAVLAEINMLGRLSIKAAKSWLGYKILKAITH